MNLTEATIRALVAGKMTGVKNLNESVQYTIVGADDLGYLRYRDEFNKYVLQPIEDVSPYTNAGSKEAVVNMLQHMVEDFDDDNLIPVIEDTKKISEPFIVFTCEDNGENPKVKGISLQTFYNDYVKNFKSSNYRNPDSDDENAQEYIEWFENKYNI